MARAIAVCPPFCGRNIGSLSALIMKARGCFHIQADEALIRTGVDL